MALLLETTLGDLVIDLDIEGSPEICKNVLKLAKTRYYTSTLVYNIQPNRFCQLGDPQGDGSGGACIYGLIAAPKNNDVLKSEQRFIKSSMGRPLTKDECRQKGRVVATEMSGIPNTIGSQLLITISDGPDMALDGFSSSVTTTTNNGGGEGTDNNGSQAQVFRSVGVIREDENNILDQIAAAYCDADGRPYADIRIRRALVVDDPFDDPPGLDGLLKERGVVLLDDNTNEDENDNERVTASPEYERPPEETVEIRIQADQVDPMTGDEDLEKMREKEEEVLKREDKSRAVVLEMLGDLPDADIKAPEHVLFVCKLNPITEDEDLELIFSRFDEKVKAEIIRDQDSGNSLQYAFIEFTTKEQAAEAYFKMDNALVDDRRIKVDFSQSVAKMWNKFDQRTKQPSGKRSNQGMPTDPFTNDRHRREPPRNRNGHQGHGGRGADHRGGGRGRAHQQNRPPQRDNFERDKRPQMHPDRRESPRTNGGRGGGRNSNVEVDQFGRQCHWGGSNRGPRHENAQDQGRPRNDVMERNSAGHDRSNRRGHHNSDEGNGVQGNRDRAKRRSRSRSRSSGKRERKHRKHHKSKKEKGEHRRHRSPDKRHERDASAPWRNPDHGGDRRRERKGDMDSRRHRDDSGRRERKDRDRSKGRRGDSEERPRDKDREEGRYKRESRDRSEKRGSRSHDDSKDDRRKRGLDDSRENDRNRERHRRDDHRSRDHHNRHRDGSKDRKDKRHRDKKEDRKRHRTSRGRSASAS